MPSHSLPRACLRSPRPLPPKTWAGRKESASCWLLITGVFFIPMLHEWLRNRRLDRRYEKADIRFVGGPFDGQSVNRRDGIGGIKWPPPDTLMSYRRIESVGEKAQWMLVFYELRQGHNRKLEYCFESERISDGPPSYPAVRVPTAVW